MQRCPKCDAMLSPNSVTCTLCGAGPNQPQAPSRGPQPPPAVVPPRVGLPPPTSIMSEEMPGAPRWAKPVYNLIAVWWVISGIASVLFAVAGTPGYGVLLAVFGAANALIGLGLLLRVEAARGIVNVVCIVQILSGLWGTLMSFLFGSPIGLISNIIQIVLAGFMIYLIGETDTRAPNL